MRRRGPRQEPRGTPVVIDPRSESCPFTLHHLPQRTKVSAVIAMDAVQIASRNLISGRTLCQLFPTEDGIQYSLVIMNWTLRCETCRLVNENGKQEIPALNC